MELNLKRKVIKLNYEGASYEVKIPSTNQLEKLVELSSKEGSNEIKLMIKFLDALGLPEAVSGEMDYMSLRELIDVLSGKKKI